MPENVLVEVLAAHADRLVGNQANGEDFLELFPDHKAELAPLLRVAERVRAVLVPVTPTPAFETGLKKDLLEAAIRRVEEQKSKKKVSFLRRRGVLIGAAVGSVLSVAGIIAALLWRQRSIARA
ncbi:MAG: hypothetical protein JSV81_14500 [Anaerolineales bacterium]|nr:MAG: hypothetical protein JSV81_14500 [Anaerolineales bacterium]